MGVGGLPRALGGSRQGSHAHAHCPNTWAPTCSLQPRLPPGSASQDSALGALVLPTRTTPHDHGTSGAVGWRSGRENEGGPLKEGAAPGQDSELRWTGQQVPFLHAIHSLQGNPSNLLNQRIRLCHALALILSKASHGSRRKVHTP